MNDQPIDDSTHTISWVSYILHLIVAVSAVIPGAQMGPALLVVALIIDLVKKGDAADWESTHFSYRIRTVIWVALLYLLTLPLWLFFFFPGWLAWVAISIWFLYRIVLGMVRLNEKRPMAD
ncbi:hypothetical protein [Limnohabitans sp. 15K]|jgi:uncharacterized membrane protein|uniref:DUF4870 family protein n=1 Tax=Limnohabitans sp. 15K TaxID=1100706 RepID=UPI000C1E00C4|nr:hypothetical protein [Limnohabitans sp. 15K]PIT81483.1 hypothetical protein B9Z40_12250 [Limnohabitans sp. 15K]